ncbi:MAG TPA: 50S ribosomal protein L25 [Planctomycetota bacterium]|jgi:large subunit ribosomal protein L25|nr:50S ribosomal protein L25 [Planctomycetota bacterium]
MRQYEMKAEVRTSAGSRSSRGLRREGRLPAVLCGHGVETRPLHVSVREFDEARKQHARVILLQLAGATEPAIIHDVAWDTITQEPLHVDFQRINMNEKVVVEVPIKTKGPSKGEAEGGILVVQLDQVRVRCLPLEIPDQIDVDIRALLQHDSIHVKDLVLPKGIEAVDAPEALVLSIVEPKKEELPVPGTAEVAPTEPELIVKAPKPGEEEEGAAAPEAGADKKGGAAPAAKKEKEKK